MSFFRSKGAAVVSSLLVGIFATFAVYRHFESLLKDRTFEARKNFAELAACRCRDGIDSQSCRSDRFVAVPELDTFSVVGGSLMEKKSVQTAGRNIFAGEISDGSGGMAFLTFKFRQVGFGSFFPLSMIALFILPLSVILPPISELIVRGLGGRLNNAKHDEVALEKGEFEIFGESIGRPFLVFDAELKVIYANKWALSESPSIVGRHVIDFSKECFELAEEIVVLKKECAQDFGYEAVKIGEVRYALLKQI